MVSAILKSNTYWQKKKSSHNLDDRLSNRQGWIGWSKQRIKKLKSRMVAQLLGSRQDTCNIAHSPDTCDGRTAAEGGKRILGGAINSWWSNYKRIKPTKFIRLNMRAFISSFSSLLRYFLSNNMKYEHRIDRVINLVLKHSFVLISIIRKSQAISMHRH
jgi:hypothetical protein